MKILCRLCDTAMPRSLSEAEVLQRQKQIERFEKLQAIIRRMPAEQQEMEGLREIYNKEMNRRAVDESRRKRAKRNAVGDGAPNDGAPSKVGANASTPPGGGADAKAGGVNASASPGGGDEASAKAGGVRDNLGMSDAIKAWEDAGLIRTGTKSHHLLSQYCKTNVAYSYCKGYDEGTAAIEKTFAGGGNIGWSPGEPEDMDGLSSEERAECVRARTEGFLHATGFVLTEVMKMPNEHELGEMCEGVSDAQKARQAGQIETPEGLQKVLKDCQKQASKSVDNQNGHRAIFNKAKLVTKDLGKQVEKHVSCWGHAHNACNLLGSLNHLKSPGQAELPARPAGLAEGGQASVSVTCSPPMPPS